MDRKNLYLFILIIFIFGFVARFYSITSHYTEVDDIGIAKTIMDSRNSTFIENIYNPEHPTYNKEYKELIRSKFNKDDFSLKIIRKIYHYLTVPFYWTYAPLQFVFTSFIVPYADTYNEFKFFGRLPSLIISIISFPFFIILSLKLFNNSKIYLNIISSSLFFLSWEYILMSQLMFNYAFAVLSITIIILYLFKTIKQKNNKYIVNGIKTGSVLSFFVYAQYQILIVIPVFISTMIFQSFKITEKKDKIELYKVIIISIFFSFIFSLPAYIWISINSFDVITNSEYAGLNGEFVFNWNNFFNSYLYLPKFFLNSFYIASSRTIAFVSEDNIFFNYIYIFFCILIVVGLISFLKDKDENCNIFGKFSLFLFLFWIILALAQKIDISPTRHFLIFLPILCLLFTKGVEFLIYQIFKKNSKIIYIKIISIVFFISLLISFLGSYSNVMENRKDMFIEKEFVELIKKYNVSEILIYDNYLANPQLMPELNKREIGIHYMSGPYANFKMNNKIQSIMFISNMFQIKNSIIANKFIQDNLKNWKKAYMVEEVKDVELEFSRLTHQTGNKLYIYIFIKN